ncbi:MAG TPA: NADH-quinone oxidoreductase subunit C [Terriglobales bacterium]|nr:NADH-quinone oxidoreductase subunit C [Terriglobales bacterium]
METAAIHQRLSQSFGSGIGESRLEVKDPWIFVEPPLIADVARFVHDDPDLAFDSLSNLSALDYKAENHIQLVYHLFSYRHRHWLILKVNADRDNPVVPSVESIWKAANWHEREAYDLLGVSFTGHPDLRRILLPEDWIGHPLRKDYVEPVEYHGISTRRESLLR